MCKNSLRKMALPLCGRRRFAPTDIFLMLQTLFEAIIPQKRKDTTIFCFHTGLDARTALKKQLFRFHNRNVFYRKASLLEHDLFNLHGNGILQYPFSNYTLCCIAADDHHTGAADLCVD